MGIANPVTRETYGSGTQYHMQLAKQLAGILQAPLEVKTKQNLIGLFKLSYSISMSSEIFFF